ncbi:MAG: phosphate ABC transporter permease PstA [Solirubrobacterales bacterium]
MSPEVRGPAPRRGARKAITSAGAIVREGRSWDDVRGTVFRYGLAACVGVGVIALSTLVIDALITGAPRLNLDLVTSMPSSRPTAAGIQSAIVGSIFLMVGVALTVLPIGVASAVYLEEYADKDRWWNKLIEVNIQNLAAVPSIVYGILGLAFIVRGPLGLGDVVAAGSLTLALLVLPTVILASREAIRAVPDSIRQGALALGATRLQTIRTQVLPASIPGIATGMILALSRAIGETAPLLLVGGVTFITFNPEFSEAGGFGSQFTALPLTIYNYVARPQEEFRVVAAAGIIILLILLVGMNSFAIALRNRYKKKMEDS